MSIDSGAEVAASCDATPQAQKTGISCGRHDVFYLYCCKCLKVQDSPFRVSFVHKWIQVQATLFSAV